MGAVRGRRTRSDCARQKPAAASRLHTKPLPRRFLPLPVETVAQRPSSSKVAAALAPSPAGEGWSLPRTRSGGEGSSGRGPPTRLGRRQQQTHQQGPALNPSPAGEGWSLPRTGSGGEGSSGRGPPTRLGRRQQQTHQQGPALNPSPAGEGWSLPRTGSGGEGSSGRGPPTRLGRRQQQTHQQGPALNPSPAGEGWSLPRTGSGGEGSSGQPSLGLRKRLLWETGRGESPRGSRIEVTRDPRSGVSPSATQPPLPVALRALPAQLMPAAGLRRIGPALVHAARSLRSACRWGRSAAGCGATPPQPPPPGP